MQFSSRLTELETVLGQQLPFVLPRARNLILTDIKCLPEYTIKQTPVVFYAESLIHEIDQPGESP